MSKAKHWVITTASSSVPRWRQHLPARTGLRDAYAFTINIKNIKYVWLAAMLLAGLNAAVLFSPMFFPEAVIGAETGVGPATAEVVSALNGSGLSASVVGVINKDHFSVQGTVVTAAGDNIQVFEYPSARVATREAETFLTNNGGGADPESGAWQKPVSLYIKGPLVIFYMGSSERIVEALDTAAGPALAGGMPAFGPETRG